MEGWWGAAGLILPLLLVYFVWIRPLRDDVASLNSKIKRLEDGLEDRVRRWVRRELGK